MWYLKHLEITVYTHVDGSIDSNDAGMDFYVLLFLNFEIKLVMEAFMHIYEDKYLKTYVLY